MIARKYNKAIGIWKTTTVSDGYGGNTVTTALEISCWANVEVKRSNRINENGQNDNVAQTVFIIRNRYNLDLSIKDNFIKYNGLIYNIDSILNVDLNNIDIEIYASQRL
jgi:SPP1 family predicted phage head-tail adaptor